MVIGLNAETQAWHSRRVTSVESRCRSTMLQTTRTHNLAGPKPSAGFRRPQLPRSVLHLISRCFICSLPARTVALLASCLAHIAIRPLHDTSWKSHHSAVIPRAEKIFYCLFWDSWFPPCERCHSRNLPFSFSSSLLAAWSGPFGVGFIAGRTTSK